jgi:hypothetical protein
VGTRNDGLYGVLRIAADSCPVESEAIVRLLDHFLMNARDEPYEWVKDALEPELLSIKSPFSLVLGSQWATYLVHCWDRKIQSVECLTSGYCVVG